LVFKSSHTGVGTSILWYRSPHRQVHQYSQRRGGPTNTSPVLGASPGRPLTALSPTPGTDRLWVRPGAEMAHVMASPMRLAGRYFIFFPLKAAYQGWLDEANLWADRWLSKLISYHAELPQSGFGSRAELHREAMQHSRSTWAGVGTDVLPWRAVQMGALDVMQNARRELAGG
jgi:hypothetical protein